MSKLAKMSRIGGELSLKSLLVGGIAMSGASVGTGFVPSAIGKIALVAAAICVAVAPLTSRADSLVTPVAATAQSWYSYGATEWRSPVNVINSSGMSTLPVTKDSTASTACSFGMWLSNGTQATWIMFDMGEVMTLTGLRVWNYNEARSSNRDYFKRGVKTCELRYGGPDMLANGDTYAKAGAWGALAGTLTFACGTGQNGLAGEDVEFAEPITTRYVMLRVLDNYGVDSYTGLSEVRFYARAVQRWYAEGASSAAAFTVMSDDLLQTAVASVDDNLTISEANVVHTTNDTYQTSDASRLTDGTFGPAGAVGGLCIQSGTVTYNLDTAAVPGGYDVSQVHVYTGWATSGGRENPSFTLLYKRVGESEFTQAGAGYYVCTITGTKNNRHACLKMKNLGLRGVEALRFDFYGATDGRGQQNLGVGYKEIDVLRDRYTMFAPVAATSENYYSSGNDVRSPLHAIDGSGMSSASGIEVDGVTASTAYSSVVWLSNNTKPTWIAFDLGAVRTVKGFHLWNYNENGYSTRGIKTADIYKGDAMPAQGTAYASSGAAWGALVQSMSFSKTPGNVNDAGNDYFFDVPVTTRYLQFAISENHGTENYTGISEIVFYADDGDVAVTRRDSGLKEVPDALGKTVTAAEGTGTAAPLTLAAETTSIDTLSVETYDGPVQIDASGKTLALGNIEIPFGTAGLEIMSGGTLTAVQGKRNWMVWNADSDLTIHGTVADNADGAVVLKKTGSGTVTIDGTDTHQGDTFYNGGGYRQTGGTVDTRGATFTGVVCEFVGGTSRATTGIALNSSAVSVAGPHSGEWRFINLASATSSLAVTNGGVLKVGYFTGGPLDFSVMLDGGTLGTSALGAATPWLPAFGAVAVGANGATFDMSGGGGVVEASITNATAGAIRKTGANTLTLKRRVEGAGPVSVEDGTLSLSLPAPIIHYDFDTMSGTAMSNLGTGGATYNGVISGSPTVVDGVGGNAFSFSANVDAVVTANAVPLRHYTYAAWVKSAGAYTPASRIIVGGDYALRETGGFLGYLGTDGSHFWVFARNVGRDDAPASTRTHSYADAENWHHIATSYDGSTVTLYIDGELAESHAANFYGESVCTVKIGFGNNINANSAEYWNGAMDEAYVFDRALSADEVAMLKEKSWKAVNVLDPGTELSIAAGATLDLDGVDQTVSTLTLGGHLRRLGPTTWGAIGSGAKHETDMITGDGILRVLGPSRSGLTLVVR